MVEGEHRQFEAVRDTELLIDVPVPGGKTEGSQLTDVQRCVIGGFVGRVRRAALLFLIHYHGNM